MKDTVMASDKKIIGAFEEVGFPKYGLSDIVAKIDTGAYTGALHCTKIEEDRTKNPKTLRFSPFDHPEVTIKTKNYRSTYIRSSNGDKEKRYVINTEIEFGGQKYPIILSLADRSAMKWPVLIGRRFLRKNRFLVDVHQGKKYAQAVKEIKQ
ncbi:MAG: ATP-dependent zinc protease family protein [Candidatus Saccharimonadales bacterium]